MLWSAAAALGLSAEAAAPGRGGRRAAPRRADRVPPPADPAGDLRRRAGRRAAAGARGAGRRRSIPCSRAIAGRCTARPPRSSPDEDVAAELEGRGRAGQGPRRLRRRRRPARAGRRPDPGRRAPVRTHARRGAGGAGRGRARPGGGAGRRGVRRAARRATSARTPSGCAARSASPWDRDPIARPCCCAPPARWPGRAAPRPRLLPRGASRRPSAPGASAARAACVETAEAGRSAPPGRDGAGRCRGPAPRRRRAARHGGARGGGPRRPARDRRRCGARTSRAGCRSACLATLEIWDDEALHDLTSRQAELTPAVGDAPTVPFGLSHLGDLDAVVAGRFGAAAAPLVALRDAART